MLLGLGGRGLWREHAVETARVLSEISPNFIRIRTLSVSPTLPMYADLEDGSFVTENDEEMVEELKLLIENLDCDSSFVSDHINNLLQEVEGKLPEDKGRMLATIERFQALPPEERHNFRIGRRARIYLGVDDLNDARKHSVVEQIIQKLGDGAHDGDQRAVDRLLEGYFVPL